MESVEIAVVDYGRKLLQADKINFRTLDLAVGVLIAVNTIADASDAYISQLEGFSESYILHL